MVFIAYFEKPTPLLRTQLKLYLIKCRYFLKIKNKNPIFDPKFVFQKHEDSSAKNSKNRKSKIRKSKIRKIEFSLIFVLKKVDFWDIFFENV